MKAILDTHVLLWALSLPARLPERFRAVLQEDENERLFSAVSIWEIAIKATLDKPGFSTNPSDALDFALRSGFGELTVVSSTAARVGTLPLHHRDPFDRLLIAQAIDEGAVLLTADATLAAYGPHVLLPE